MSRRCTDSWINTYLEYNKNREAPIDFSAWTAIATIGTCLGRSTWFPRPGYVIYPNLFVILVAASAKMRKSSAVDVGRLYLNTVPEPPTTFSQKITPEALIGCMKDGKKNGECNALILSGELSVFMGPNISQSGLVDILTDLYDSRDGWEYTTRARGKEKIEKFTLSMLAATTKHSIRECLPKGSVGGGLTSRIIFVSREKRGKPHLFNPLDEFGHEVYETQEQTLLRRRLMDDLNEINTKMKGDFRMTPQARAHAEAWYNEAYEEVHDEQVEGYFGRKHDIMFKVCMILSAARSNDLVIEKSHVEEALETLEQNEKSMSVIVSSVIASDSGTTIERMLNIVRKHGRIRHSDLIHKCWRFATAIEIGTMIKILLDSKDLVEEISPDNRTRWYKTGGR